MITLMVTHMVTVTVTLMVTLTVSRPRPRLEGGGTAQL